MTNLFKKEGKTDEKKKDFFVTYCKIPKQVFSAMQKLYKDKEYVLNFVKTVREKKISWYQTKLLIYFIIIIF